jgi:hypothetical protein
MERKKDQGSLPLVAYSIFYAGFYACTYILLFNMPHPALLFTDPFDYYNCWLADRFVPAAIYCNTYYRTLVLLGCRLACTDLLSGATSDLPLFLCACACAEAMPNRDSAGS